MNLDLQHEKGWSYKVDIWVEFFKSLGLLSDQSNLS